MAPQKGSSGGGGGGGGGGSAGKDEDQNIFTLLEEVDTAMLDFRLVTGLKDIKEDLLVSLAARLPSKKGVLTKRTLKDKSTEAIDLLE